MMRKLLLVGTVGLALSFVSPNNSDAQWAVTCTNCDTIWQSVLAYGKQLQQLQTQLQQYSTQIQQYANQVQNTISLPSTVWSTINGDVTRMQSLVTQAKMLNGNLPSMLTRLNSISSYANNITTMGGMTSQLQQWSNMASNDYSNIQKLLADKETQQVADAALLRQAEANVAGSTGAVQALQANGAVAALAAAQLQKTNETLTAQMQFNTEQAAIAADRQAMADGAMTSFLSPQLFSTSGYPSY